MSDMAEHRGAVGPARATDAQDDLDDDDTGLHDGFGVLGHDPDESDVGYAFAAQAEAVLRE